MTSVSVNSSTPEFSFGGYAGYDTSIEGVGFWPRAAARVIDTGVSFIVGIAAGLLSAVLMAIAGAITGTDIGPALASMQKSGLSGFVISLVATLGYQVICEWGHGSSLGKLIMGQVVIMEDRTPCSLKAAVIRSVAYYFDVLFFGLIGYFAMQKTALNQRHGDEWAKTIVCKRASLEPGQVRGPGRFTAVFV